MTKEMAHGDDTDSDNEQTDHANDQSSPSDGPRVVPKFNVANLKSQVAILRIIEMILCLMAFIFLQVAIKCKWAHVVGTGKEYYTQLCQCPSDFIYRCYSASAAVVFFVALVMFCLHISNLMEVLSNIPWRLVIMIQTGSSSIMLVLAIAILGHGNYVDDSGLLIAVHFFGLFAAVIFALHFFWELILYRRARSPGTIKPENIDHHEARDNANYEGSEYDDCAPSGGYSFNVVDYDENDDGDASGGRATPTICAIKKRNSYSLDMVDTVGGVPPSWPPKGHHSASDERMAGNTKTTSGFKATSGSNSSRSGEGADRSLHGYHSNSSGSEGKGSWVIPGGAKEDTMSTNTYTVDVPLH